MANEDYPADRTHIEWAKKMTTWRHADAKLTSAEVVAPDNLIQIAELSEPIGYAEPRQKADTLIPIYETTRYNIGSLSEIYYLQTGRLLYPAIGACTTVEDSPSAGYHTHTITKRTSQTPLNMGRHLERENETDAESERIDILGMLLTSYHAECSQTRTRAFQTADWRVAFTKNTSTDDITKPTELAAHPFEWDQLSFPVFTYNSETIEATIMAWAFDVQNEVGWRGLDSTHYYSIGKMFNYTDISVSLMIIPKGKNAFELIRTNKESYATDLDLTWKFTRNATNDYVQVAHDKMYIEPFSIKPGHKLGWHEGYLITLHQDGSGSITGTIIDNLNNDYYENP